MTIPADIMRAAERAWLEMHREGNISTDGLPIIARAIMEAKAEVREQCALIADDYSMIAMARANRAALRDKKIHENAIFVAGEIASAIRNGEHG